MLSRTALLAAAILALTLGGCSNDPTDPGGSDAPTANYEGYPTVPKPTAVDDFDQPDQSEVFSVVTPLAGKHIDFTPLWSAGTFTWDIDIQTQYEAFTSQGWVWTGDPPADYWSGTRHTSQLTFENGAVDLRNPTPKNSPLLGEPTYTYAPMPRRLKFIQDGVVLAEPSNPKVDASACNFQFLPADGTPDVTFDPGIFVGYWTLDVENGFNQRSKRRAYYVAASSAPSLTNPVHMMRERFWERVLVDDTKSVRVDPGFQKSVSYTRTNGTSYENSYAFARSIEGEASISPFDVGIKATGSLSETWSSSVTVTEQEDLSVTHTVTGIDGKTIIFSVWQSVERYSFVDEDGNPYTDPNYTFDDLGNLEIRGDHEILQSAIFDYGQ